MLHATTIRLISLDASEWGFVTTSAVSVFPSLWVKLIYTVASLHEQPSGFLVLYCTIMESHNYSTRCVSHIYTFGDQTPDVSNNLSALLHLAPRDVLLTAFLDGAHRGLRAELGRLPALESSSLPRFSSIRNLVALSRQRCLPPAFHPALTCIYQLACIISGGSKNRHLYTSHEGVFVVGSCTGSLAAAAVAGALTMSELVESGIEAVRVAFRLGICAVRNGRAVEESSSDVSRSWTIIACGLSLHQIERRLADFSNQKGLPAASRPYVSAIGESSTSISGPPSILKTLEEECFDDSRILECPTSAPFHSSTLFSQYDINAILEPLSTEARNRKINLPLISSFSGKLSNARTYGDLLGEVVEDILCNPIVWENIIHGVAHLTSFRRHQQINVIPVGVNSQATALYNALHQRGFSANLLKDIFSTLESEVIENFKTPSGKSKIAIVGVSGRFPNADDMDEYWDILFKGLDVHDIVPETRWSLNHFDPSGKRKNTSRTKFGCWLKKPGHFDAPFFGISPREALQMDPASRIALMTTYEAMEQAGVVPDSTPSSMRDRIGVFYGVTSNDWMEVNSAQNIDTYFIPGGCRAFIPGRINYCFKFTGPSLSIDTACSSSLTALHTACNALWQGDIDMAVSGGTNVLTNPDYTAGLDKGHFLSKTGNCKPFDDGADGYCRGEGVVTLILKRLEDAVAENDPIIGIIAGAHTNHSAEAESITRPHADIQKAVFSTIMNDAGVVADDIGYVEMHGTGTQAGDVVEMKSVLETFASPQPREAPLYLGSTKANIGHGEAASGVSSVAKALLMLRHNTIPLHCGIKTRLNRKFPDLNNQNVHIARESLPWEKEAKKARRLFVNNFSAAGGNTAVLIEDAFEAPELSVDLRTSHIITLSAKSSSALLRNAESMLDFLKTTTTSDGMLSSLGYTTTARRTHHAHRLAVSGSSIESITSDLQKEISQYIPAKPTKNSPRIVFAFTGNGTQYPGMGKELFENFASFRADILRLDQLAQTQGFPSIVPYCSTSIGDETEPPTLVVQLAVVCLEIALSRLWRCWGIVPDSVVGHSLGEYAALNVAGVLSDADTIYLVGRRARLLQEECTAGTHSMLAVSAPGYQISNLIKSTGCEIACINGPNDMVLSGPTIAIRNLHASLKVQRVKATVLQVAYAFHSSQVDVILDAFQGLCAGVQFRKPRIPILSPLRGSIIDSAGILDAKYLAKHCKQPVDMVKAFESARSHGHIAENSIVLELGPQPIFAAMVRNILGSTVTTLPSIRRGQAMWPVLTKTLVALYTLGVGIDWKEYHVGFESCARVISLPAYSWDLKDYWIQYVNDWSLRKGEPAVASSRPTVTMPIVTTPKASWTSSKYQLLEETLQNGRGTMIIEADLQKSGIGAISAGHQVKGIPLATPAVYADAALTMGTYLLKRHFTDNGLIVEIRDLVIEKALIPSTDGDTRMLRITAAVDLVEKRVSCKFSTHPIKGSPIQHSHCTVHFISEEQVRQKSTQLGNQARSINQSLNASADNGHAYRFNKPMIYRMVSSLAQFAYEYKCVDEIVLDSSTFEASSQVQFSKDAAGFHCHPAFIDALTQSAGFVMNANDHSSLETKVFVNHGWKAFRMFKDLDSRKKYSTAIRIEEKPDKSWVGDLVVLEGDDVVAGFDGITLHEVPRRALEMILAQEQRQQCPKSITEPVGYLKLPQTPQSDRKPSKDTDSRLPNEYPLIQEFKAPNVLNPPTTFADSRIIATTSATPTSGLSDILRIISEETGIPEEEIDDTSDFAAMGVDSLMTLVMAGKMRDELNLDVDSTTLNDFPTIGDLMRHVNKTLVVSSTPNVANSVQVSALEVDNSISRIGRGSASNSQVFNAMVDITLRIIAEETGCALSEMDDSTEFSSMGVDSLLSMVLVSRWNDEAGLEVSGDATAFCASLTSVAGLKTYIHEKMARSLQQSETVSRYEHSRSQGSTSANSSVSGKTNLSTSTLITSPAHSRSTSPAPKQLSPQKPLFREPVRPATSVILHGRPKQSEKVLFLFPDGSGSAASYAQLPQISHTTATIALNSPYYHHPEEMTCQLEDIMTSYLAELRRRQSTGPYNLGGWSSGGIIAYRAAQLLIQDGEEIESLLLIDSPPPTRGLDRLPQRWYDQCADVDIFGHMDGGAKQGRLMEHFKATIELLHHYCADPLPEGFVPNVLIMWAGECVFDGLAMPKFKNNMNDPEGVKFLTEKRVDRSAGDWAVLFPGVHIKVEYLEGVNHFSILKEHSVRLAGILERALR
ncbi:beta-ketoacyl synthase [Massariosphaeria phaeospora]|uniref:Beta-ketoacyl synthase n=1 Tax=Massariosphaeria phaeospora TaxID=100035 RepID=A0A7C8I981_9PLEO|nr:beta-ketoacyl synthase [Massariosphaeria phaeospora]